MAALDTISIAILLGSLLVLAGILSSLIALRFGAPLLLVFLILGMLAGEGGPGGIPFNNVAAAYTVGSIALALILFDGGLRTRLASFRSVLAPAVTSGDGRRAGHRAFDRADRQAGARSQLDAEPAGRRGGGLDRRGGRILPDQRARLAPAPARARDPRGRIRHQRSLRRVSHPAAGAGLEQRPSELRRRAAHPSARRRHRLCHRLSRRTRHHLGAQPACAAARPARSLRGGRCARRIRLRQCGARFRFPRRLSRRPGARQPADARAQFGRRVSRCRHLARADRHVRPARAFGVAAAPDRKRHRSRRGGAGADPDRAPGCCFPLPLAVQLSLAREAVHLLGGPARCGRDFSRLHSAPGRTAGGLSLFRRRLRGGAVLAVDPGLERRLRRAQARHVVRARRPAAAPGRARPARPTRARDRRLSGDIE